MSSTVNCDCGEVIRAETDDELVSAVGAHVERDHPELVGKLGATTSSPWQKSTRNRIESEGLSRRPAARRSAPRRRCGVVTARDAR